MVLITMILHFFLQYQDIFQLVSSFKILNFNNTIPRKRRLKRIRFIQLLTPCSNPKRRREKIVYTFLYTTYFKVVVQFYMNVCMVPFAAFSSSSSQKERYYSPEPSLVVTAEGNATMPERNLQVSSPSSRRLQWKSSQTQTVKATIEKGAAVPMAFSR